MRWQLLEPHHIDEQVLPAGTIIGDDTQWPYRSTYNEKKDRYGKGVDRKIGDPLPPSTAMTPMDDEARKVFDETFGGEVPNTDPTKSIPLTGAPGAPSVRGPGQPAPTQKPQPVNQPPTEVPKTGMAAPNPPGHDSAKNPGDSKDTVTARTPDIKKI